MVDDDYGDQEFLSGVVYGAVLGLVAALVIMIFIYGQFA